MFTALRPAVRVSARVSPRPARHARPPLADLVLVVCPPPARITRALQAFSTSRPSADYAKLSLIGRIGAEPVLKTNKNGKDFLIYKVATSDPYIPAKEGG